MIAPEAFIERDNFLVAERLGRSVYFVLLKQQSGAEGHDDTGVRPGEGKCAGFFSSSGARAWPGSSRPSSTRRARSGLRFPSPSKVARTCLV